MRQPRQPITAEAKTQIAKDIAAANRRLLRGMDGYEKLVFRTPGHVLFKAPKPASVSRRLDTMLAHARRRFSGQAGGGT